MLTIVSLRHIWVCLKTFRLMMLPIPYYCSSGKPSKGVGVECELLAQYLYTKIGSLLQLHLSSKFGDDILKLINGIVGW